MLDRRELAVHGLQVTVPEGWGATWDPDSTLLLFPPSDQSTALRISEITALSPKPLEANAPVEWLHDFKKVALSATETMPSGAMLGSRDSVFTEAGTLVHIRFWYRVQVALPDTLHIGIISLAQEVQSARDSLRSGYVAAAENLVRAAAYQRR
jgi:hypothetical protein